MSIILASKLSSQVSHDLRRLLSTVVPLLSCLPEHPQAPRLHREWYQHRKTQRGIFCAVALDGMPE